MKKIVIHATLSLDGYIARNDDDMSWMADYVGPNRVVGEVVRQVGSVVGDGRYSSFKRTNCCLVPAVTNGERGLSCTIAKLPRLGW